MFPLVQTGLMRNKGSYPAIIDSKATYKELHSCLPSSPCHEVKAGGWREGSDATPTNYKQEVHLKLYFNIHTKGESKSCFFAYLYFSKLIPWFLQ